eukprot:gene4324-5413_t
MFSRLISSRFIPQAFAFASKRAYSTANKFYQQSNQYIASNKAKLIVGSTVVAASTIGFVSCADKIPLVGVPGTKNERTFIAIKPDGVARGLISEVIDRFERKGLKLVGIKIVHPTEEFAAKHYDDLKTKPFFGGLVKYFSSGAVVAMVWEGKGAIKTGRAILGATNPADSAPGTLRFDYCIEVGRNLVHGSDGVESAADEITLWFKEHEIAEWGATQQNQWVYEKN